MVDVVDENKRSLIFFKRLGNECVETYIGYIYQSETDYPACLPLTHDYTPEWDYETRDLSEFGEYEGCIRFALKRAVEELLPALGINCVILFLAEKGALPDNTVGIHVDGTSGCPVIGIDIATLRENLAYREDFTHEIMMTIAHELGHALINQRLDGCDACRHHNEEDAVEEFARDWVDGGNINTAILENFVDQTIADAAPLKSF